MSDVILIKSKPRQDSIFDLYSRVFVKRTLLVTILLVGANWLSDTVTCVIPASATLDRYYVAEICLIQGYYVYEEIGSNNTHGFYGIPSNINHDGRNSRTGELCTRRINGTVDESCIPMKQKWFKQYQSMHFVFAGLLVLYCFPYVIFKIANSDMLALSEDLEKESRKDENRKLFGKESSATDGAHDLLIKYFDVEDARQGLIRIAGIIFVKFLYVFNNIFAFHYTNNVLDGNFVRFGSSWEWRNELLPASGICQVGSQYFLMKRVFYHYANPFFKMFQRYQKK